MEACYLRAKKYLFHYEVFKSEEVKSYQEEAKLVAVLAVTSVIFAYYLKGYSIKNIFRQKAVTLLATGLLAYTPQLIRNLVYYKCFQVYRDRIEGALRGQNQNAQDPYYLAQISNALIAAPLSTKFELYDLIVDENPTLAVRVLFQVRESHEPLQLDVLTKVFKKLAQEYGSACSVPQAFLSKLLPSIQSASFDYLTEDESSAISQLSEYMRRDSTKDAQVLKQAEEIEAARNEREEVLKQAKKDLETIDENTANRAELTKLSKARQLLGLGRHKPTPDKLEAQARKEAEEDEVLAQAEKIKSIQLSEEELDLLRQKAERATSKLQSIELAQKDLSALSAILEGVDTSRKEEQEAVLKKSSEIADLLVADKDLFSPNLIYKLFTFLLLDELNKEEGPNLLTVDRQLQYSFFYAFFIEQVSRSETVPLRLSTFLSASGFDSRAETELKIRALALLQLLGVFRDRLSLITTSKDYAQLAKSGSLGGVSKTYFNEMKLPYKELYRVLYPSFESFCERAGYTLGDVYTPEVLERFGVYYDTYGIATDSETGEGLKDFELYRSLASDLDNTCRGWDAYLEFLYRAPSVLPSHIVGEVGLDPFYEAVRPTLRSMLQEQQTSTLEECLSDCLIRELEYFKDPKAQFTLLGEIYQTGDAFQYRMSPRAQFFVFERLRADLPSTAIPSKFYEFIAMGQAFFVKAAEHGFYMKWEREGISESTEGSIGMTSETYEQSLKQRSRDVSQRRFKGFQTGWKTCLTPLFMERAGIK